MPYFERIVFAQELHREKKDPALWRLGGGDGGGQSGGLHAVRRLGGGLPGRKAAGMRAVGVYDPFFAATETEMRAVCSRYIRSFEELV